MFKAEAETVEAPSGQMTPFKDRTLVYAMLALVAVIVILVLMLR